MSRATHDMKAAATLPAAVGCDGKVRFASFQRADEVSRERKRRRTRKNRQVYRCAHCGMWHLGSDPAKSRVMRAQLRRERRASQEGDINE